MKEQALNKYAEFLMKFSKLGIGVIVIILIVFAIAFFVFVKIGCIKELIVRIALVVFLLLMPVTYFTSVLPYQLDIKQQSYEKYVGEFYVESYYFATNSGVHILLKRPTDKKSVKYRAPANLQNIEENTSYYGELTIAKHSKVLVDISIE